MLGVIATDRAAAAVRVTIYISADDGHGLGSRYAEALFQEALRLRQAASDEGLAAARLGLLRRHGGQVAHQLHRGPRLGAFATLGADQDAVAGP